MRGLRRRLAASGIQPVPVEYIHADKRQMIQTDWVPGLAPKIELDMRLDNLVQTTGLNNTIFGVAEADRNVIFTMNFGGSANQGAQIYIWNDKQYNSGGVIHKIECNDFTFRFQFSMGAKIADFKFQNMYGTHYTVTESLETRTAANTKPIMLLGSTGAPLSRWDVWLYGVKCWNDGVLERDYVPVEKNGVYGLLDKIEGKFLTSNTGVDFLGPE